MEWDKKRFFIYCSFHFSVCPVEIREVWTKAFSTFEGRRTLKKMIEDQVDGHALEVVTIATCNRFDICVVGDVSESAFLASLMEMTKKLDLPAPPKEISNSPLWDENVLRKIVRLHFDAQALQMLFRTASSLDSLVLGEPHILGQIKECFQLSLSEDLCGSHASSIFNRCFQVAKRARSETDLGRNAVSIGHAAVELAQRVFENLGDCTALVIGAGEMGRLAAQHLVSKGISGLTIANRTLEKASNIAVKLGPTAQSLPIEKALSNLGSYDIVIVATSSQGFVLEPKHLKNHAKARAGRTAVVVDISVPRNVDPALSQIESVFLFDIDDLDKIMHNNRLARMDAATEAEFIVQSEVEDFIAARKKRKELASVGKFHSWIQGLVAQEVEKSLRGGKVDSKTIADAVAKKIVSSPALKAKSEFQVEENETVGGLLEKLFRLSEQPLLIAKKKSNNKKNAASASKNSNVIQIRSRHRG